MKKLCSKYPLAIVFAVAFVSLLYVMVFREFSPANEARYVRIAADALEKGNWFTFYLDGKMYTDKPPMFFQLMMLLRLVLGSFNKLALYLVSFLSSCGIVAVMDREFVRERPVLQRIAFASVFLGCGLVIGESVFLRMDLLMTFFIVWALAAFHKAYLRGKYSWAVPLCTFAAFYTKGPVGLIFPLVTIFVFLLLLRDYRSVRTYLGWKTWGVLTGLSALWFVMVYVEGGADYLRSLVFGQMIDRVFHGAIHRHSFFYYFWVFPLCVLPFSVLLAPAVCRPMALLSSRRVRVGELPVAQLLMTVAVVVNFLILSLCPSKLSIYITPLVPFAVYLVPFLPQEKWVDNVFRATNVLVSLVCLAAVVVLVLGRRIGFFAVIDYFYLCTRSFVVACVGLLVSLAGVYVSFSKKHDKCLGLVLATLSLYVMILLASPLVQDSNVVLYGL